MGKITDEPHEPFKAIDGYSVRRKLDGKWQYLNQRRGVWLRGLEKATIFQTRNAAIAYRDEFDEDAEVFHNGF